MVLLLLRKISTLKTNLSALAIITQELYSIYKINETCTNKYYKVFYTTECNQYCNQCDCGGFVIQCTTHNAQCTIKQQFCANVVYEAFCGVVAADDMVADIGVCGNDGDNGVDDVFM